MISIRKLEYSSDESPENVFSRLSVDVEQVDSLAAQLITNMTVNTNRPWIGVCEANDMKFKLIEPGEFSNIKLYQIIVEGRMVAEENSTKIKLRIGLGWQTFLKYLIAYLITVSVLLAIIFSNESKDIWLLITWVLFFPGISTYFLIRKLNKVEGKIESSLRVVRR